MNLNDLKRSAQHNGKSFVNPAALQPQGIGVLPKIISQMLFDKQQPSTPQKPIPVNKITPERLANLPENETIIFKLGHSSLLLWIENEFWLIDPVFSERASPFTFIGPKRFHPTPIDIDALPDIKGVILSHNHYDHLDEASIKQLIGKTELFIAPLGVGATLVQWGVDSNRIREFDWYDSLQIGNISLTATPSQHFSGRGLSDRNQSLWASWVIASSQHKIFFSGDSGYFDGFKQIGEKYGPFDISFIESGAYNTLWPDVHMMPDETVKAFIDLNGGVLVPIHNSTFDLSVHAWYHPLEQVLKYAQDQDVSLLVPQMGSEINLNSLPKLELWWQKLM
ncbi:MAG: MBL fold metallo-hydrolase [Rhizobiales bacterium]|nr:MBL fold metallo-hydrolase [Hyphomicrobiales bacterium]